MIVRDVPLGPPRVWTFAVEITGLNEYAAWSGRIGPTAFSGSGQHTQTYEAHVALQDVMRWEMVRQTDGTDQLQVRHTRYAPPKVHDYDEYQAGYGIVVNVSALVHDFVTPGVPNYDTATLNATARITAYGPDGQRIGSADLPPVFVGGFFDKTGSDGFSHRSVYKNIVNATPKTNLLVDIQARRWPSGEPIAGLEVTAFSNVTIHGAGPFAFPLLVTDAAGNATLDTASPPPAWPTDTPWTGAAGNGSALASDRRPVVAQARTQALSTGGLDYSQPYARSTQRGNDDAGYFELWRVPGLVQFSRASSYTLDAAAWSSYSGGTGLSRGLSAAQGQAARQFRYLRLRVHASAPASARVGLSTDWVNPDPGAGEPPVSSRSTSAPVSIAAGDNTFEIDLIGIAAQPFGAYGDFYHQTRGWIEGGSTWNVVLPDYRKGSAADAGKWDGHNPNSISLQGLTAGETYTVQEVTFFDKSGTGRTPLRVLGSAMPGTGGAPFTPLSGPPSYINADGGIVRMLANGRLVASAPPSFRDVTQDVYAFGPGSALLSTKILSAADLMDRWREYYDGGAGIWTLATDDPDTAALFPQVMMEPSAVTDHGFALDGLACSPTLIVAPGFDLTVSPRVTLHLNLGGVVEGLLFDDTSRRGGQGKTVRSSIQQPPAGDALSPPGPVTELTATADADGYFALSDLFQPQYWPNTFALQQKYDPGAAVRGYVIPYLTRHQLWADDDPPVPGKAESSAGRPYVSPSDPGDPWEVVVGHRNSVYFYDLARLLRALSEQDMAQDLATGRILHVWSDATSGGLTAEAREGRLGLAGTPARAAQAITNSAGAPRLGANPSLWVTHETGLASLVYAQGDGTGPIVRADSQDGLVSLGSESVSLFSRSGGYPYHFRDSSTGIAYVFAAFDDTDGTQTVLAVRQNALGALLTWADGTTEKTVATGLTAAGRPIVQPNRYDAVQSLLLMHGDRRYSSPNGGETWSEIVS